MMDSPKVRVCVLQHSKDHCSRSLSIVCSESSSTRSEVVLEISTRVWHSDEALFPAEGLNRFTRIPSSEGRSAVVKLTIMPESLPVERLWEFPASCQACCTCHEYLFITLKQETTKNKKRHLKSWKKDFSYT